MGKKRGQITLYMIIAMVLIIGAVTYIFIKEDAMRVEDHELIVEPEMVPVKEYFESCMSLAAKDAIKQLGILGGRMNVPPEVEYNPRSYLAFDAKGVLKIPYWHYDGRYNVLSLEEIKKQFEERVKVDTLRCVDGFSGLIEVFEVEEQGDLGITADFTEKEVIVDAIYPIKVTAKGTGNSAKINRFRSILDVEFKRIYDFANELLAAEVDDLFFEQMTVDLMAMNPDIPFSGLEFSCAPKIWFIHDVKKEIQDTLRVNVADIRVENTIHEPFLEDESAYKAYEKLDFEDVGRAYMTDEEQIDVFGDVKKSNLPEEPPPADAYEYFNLYWKFPEEYYNYRVLFDYNPNWGMRLVSRPSDGVKMSSRMGRGAKQYLSYLCVNSYHFTYDVEYPLLVKIVDENAFRGEGYVFRFAFPVLIDHNEGNRGSAGTTVSDFIPVYIDSCGDLTGQYTINVNGDYEGYVNWKLEGVNLSYNCLKTICPLGKTDEEGQFITGLPSNCGNGFIVAEHDGYLKKQQQVLDNNIDIEMSKLTKVKVNVVKHSLSVPERFYDFGEGDTLMVVLDNKYEDHIVYFAINSSELGEKEIEILRATTEYYAQLLLIDKEGEFYGGYNFNWSYAKSDVGDTVTFHVLESIPKPNAESVVDDLTAYELFEKYAIFQEIDNPVHMAYMAPEFS